MIRELLGGPFIAWDLLTWLGIICLSLMYLIVMSLIDSKGITIEWILYSVLLIIAMMLWVWFSKGI